MSTKINFSGDQFDLKNDPSKSFMELAEEQWQNIPSSCKSGYCMVCACKIRKGLDQIDKELKWIMIATGDETLVLPCIAGPISSNSEIELESL